MDIYKVAKTSLSFIAGIGAEEVIRDITLKVMPENASKIGKAVRLIGSGMVGAGVGAFAGTQLGNTMDELKKIFTETKEKAEEKAADIIDKHDSDGDGKLTRDEIAEAAKKEFEALKEKYGKLYDELLENEGIPEA